MEYGFEYGCEHGFLHDFDKDFNMIFIWPLLENARFHMGHIYNKSGSYTVVGGGIVIAHNVTKQEALKKVEEYDFG